MPVFIAKNYHGKVIDVVLTHNRELASAYWQGKSVIPHIIEMRSDADLSGHPTGVLPIVSTDGLELKSSDTGYRTYIVIK